MNDLKVREQATWTSGERPLLTERMNEVVGLKCARNKCDALSITPGTWHVLRVSATFAFSRVSR